MYVNQKVLRFYLPKMKISFFVIASMNDFFVKISGFFDFNIPHFSDSFTFDSRLHTRQGNGAAEGLKFALIKLPARNNNSDFWFNPISIFHITGFSAGIILSSKHFNLFFWKFFWFVLIYWFLSCVKLLIIDGWARATHTHYAKWLSAVS